MERAADEAQQFAWLGVVETVTLGPPSPERRPFSFERAQGNLSAAFDSYRAAFCITERQAKSDPANAGWQRDLSVFHEKIGNMLQAQDNLSAALDSYRASLAISERLTRADPGDASWQRDLSVSLRT